MADVIKQAPGNAAYAEYLRVTNFRFNVTVDQTEIGFQKVSGLENTTDVIEYREGNETEVFHKLPGLTKTGNVTMERALIKASGGGPSPTFFKDWYNQIIDVINGTGTKTFRKTIKVSTFDRDVFPAGAAAGAASASWTLYNCWPVKVAWTDLDASGNDLVHETVELAVEHIKRVL